MALNIMVVSSPYLAIPHLSTVCDVFSKAVSGAVDSLLKRRHECTQHLFDVQIDFVRNRVEAVVCAINYKPYWSFVEKTSVKQELNPK